MRVTLRCALGLASALAMLLTGCGRSGPPALPDATSTVSALASALVSGDISGLPFAASSVDPVQDFGVITAGMNGVRPSTVTVGDITYDSTSQTATANLDQTYDFSTPWTFTSVVGLQYMGSDGWQIDWSPGIVNPSVDGFTRLSITTSAPTRGSILARDGQAIVYNRDVFNVGIDKMNCPDEQMDASARQLAQAVGIDPDAYAQQVAGGGPSQFVIAITYRAGQVPVGVDQIACSLAQKSTLPLAPTKMFAIGVLGTAGDATAEDIQNSNGAFKAGDVVGKSGLQKSQNALLMGQPGTTVYIGPRASGDVMNTSSSAAPTAPAVTKKQVLFQADAVNGADLHTTMDIDLQTKAEAVLAGQADVASLVVLDSQTGAILAAANSPASGGNPYATTGQYAPGSTFKVSAALALLRSGMTPDSPINCPSSVTVDGKPFSNDPNFSNTGTLSLQQAVAYSCNTAMVNGSLTLGMGDLPAAAASLGIGVKHDLGFPAFLGTVPTPTTNVEKAASAFGQAQIVVSPLAMATEAASVAAGHTVVPYLLTDASGLPIIDPSDGQATPSPETARPLSATEASQLRAMMADVVTYGTAAGTGLTGLVDGAKTGTAEFTQDGQTLTHAWMIAFNGQYAICAFVNVGSFGATTAGPIVKAFLTS